MYENWFYQQILLSLSGKFRESADINFIWVMKKMLKYSHLRIGLNFQEFSPKIHLLPRYLLILKLATVVKGN